MMGQSSGKDKQQLKGIKSISHSNYHSILNNSNAQTLLFVTGSNTSGQLGLPSSVQSVDGWERVKTKLEGCNEQESDYLLSNITELAVGRSHLIISTKTNQLFACGKNNYNQIGLNIPKSESSYLFRSLNEEILEAMKEAKIIERNYLLKYLNNEELIDRFLNYLFDRIHNISLIACGWFHSLIIVNDILVFGAGHSYFSQLFNAEFKPNFSYLGSRLRLIDENYLIEYSNGLQCLQKVTHLSCGTFSSSLVVNNCKVYSCGEIIGMTDETCYLKASKIFDGKKVFILQMSHTDGGIMVLTNESKLMICEQHRDVFTCVKDNVVTFCGGHMCKEYTYLQREKNSYSIHFDESTISTNHSEVTFPETVNFSEGCNFTIFGGYYSFYFSFDRKSLYKNTNGNNPEQIIGPAGITKEGKSKELSDCLAGEYFIKKVEIGCDLSVMLLTKAGISKHEIEMKMKLKKQLEELTNLSDLEIICLQ
ncbi:hypothetical protein ABK040_013845 [Willaertia magna]